jgi:hypothetical protein
MEQQEYHKAINFSHLAQEKEVLNNTTTYSIVLDNLLLLFQSEQSKAFAYLNQSQKIEKKINDRGLIKLLSPFRILQ